MIQQRWLRIIPVALIMYTISYVDRTNISLALDPQISTMMKDLFMDDKLKGEAAGIFFFGYVLLQLPGGYLATHWSARKIISIFLVCWGACAVGCGLVGTFQQFEWTRFFLGVAESGVFPATTVLLANWFPRAERARANAYWNLCQPLAVAVSGPFSGWLLGLRDQGWLSHALATASAPFTPALAGPWGWRQMLVLEGALPFVWLPIWWYFVRDHPREAPWISLEEREHLETTLRAEAAASEPATKKAVWRMLFAPAFLVLAGIYGVQICAAYWGLPGLTHGLKGTEDSLLLYGLWWAVPYAAVTVVVTFLCLWADQKRPRRDQVSFVNPTLLVMVGIYFLHNCAAYGCMTFFTTGLKGRGFSPFQYGLLFAVPYAVTAVIMILISRHSDQTRERRGHAGFIYGLSGVCLILSVLCQQHFWVSYGLLCLAIPGPFAAMAPFWAIPSEVLPRSLLGLVVGIVNAVGNIGGFVGQFLVGWLVKEYHDNHRAFELLGLGMIIAAALCFLLPKSAPPPPANKPA